MKSLVNQIADIQSTHVALVDEYTGLKDTWWSIGGIPVGKLTKLATKYPKKDYDYDRGKKCMRLHITGDPHCVIFVYSVPCKVETNIIATK